MADMDPMSVAIGKLTSEAEAGKNQRTAMFTKIDKIESDVATLVKTVEKGIVSTQDALKGHADKLDSHGRHISTLNKFKQRCYIGLAGSTGIGGIFAGIKTKFGL
jgi:hypothetical protein